MQHKTALYCQKLGPASLTSWCLTSPIIYSILKSARSLGWFCSTSKLSPSGWRLSWNKHTLCNRVWVCPQGAANLGIKQRRLLVSRQKTPFTAGAVGSSVSGWQTERKWKNLEVLFQRLITPKTISYRSSTGNRRLPSGGFRCLGSWRTRTYPWQPLLRSGCLQLFGAFWIKSPHLHGFFKIYLFIFSVGGESEPSLARSRVV